MAIFICKRLQLHAAHAASTAPNGRLRFVSRKLARAQINNNIQRSSLWPSLTQQKTRTVQLAQFNIRRSSLWLSLTQQKTRKFSVTLLPTFPHILAVSASAPPSACHCHCHCLNHTTNSSFPHFHCLISLSLIGCMFFIAFFFPLF